MTFRSIRNYIAVQDKKRSLVHLVAGKFFVNNWIHVSVFSNQIFGLILIFGLLFMWWHWCILHINHIKVGNSLRIRVYGRILIIYHGLYYFWGLKICFIRGASDPYINFHVLRKYNINIWLMIYYIVIIKLHFFLVNTNWEKGLITSLNMWKDWSHIQQAWKYFENKGGKTRNICIFYRLEFDVVTSGTTYVYTRIYLISHYLVWKKIHCSCPIPYLLKLKNITVSYFNANKLEIFGLIYKGNYHRMKGETELD